MQKWGDLMFSMYCGGLRFSTRLLAQYRILWQVPFARIVHLRTCCPKPTVVVFLDLLPKPIRQWPGPALVVANGPAKDASAAIDFQAQGHKRQPATRTNSFDSSSRSHAFCRL